MDNNDKDINMNADCSSPEQLCSTIREDIETYDGILFGFGTELFKQKNEDINDVLDKLAEYLNHKNCFIISSIKEDTLRKSGLNQKRIVCPYLAETDKETEDKQWELYNKWLSGTLAKKLLVIELGENFNNPNLIKWPFERVVMINDKARFYRIHSMFYQIPPEIKDKSVTYKYDSYEILKMLVNIVK